MNKKQRLLRTQNLFQKIQIEVAWIWIRRIIKRNRRIPQQTNMHTCLLHQRRSKQQTPKGGLPIQVFESEERAPRGSKQRGGPEGMMPDSMGGGSPFPNPIMMGGPPGDMSWMMGGMPPGMNPAAAAMMRNQFGFGMPDFGNGGPDMDMGMAGGMPRPPFMNPGFQGNFGGPDDMYGMGPMPGMPPPPEMMATFASAGGPGMNMFGGGGRGGGTFGIRGGRGGMRGGRSSGPPRRQDPDDNDSVSRRDEQGSDSGAKAVAMAGPDEAIPTGPRAERESYPATSNGHYSQGRSSSRRRHGSRSPSTSSSIRRDHHHHRENRSRKRSPSWSRSPSPSRHRRSRTGSRSPSRARSSRGDKDRDRHSSSSKDYRSSRHQSSRYRSRERGRGRDKDKDKEKEKDKDRRREKSRDSRSRHRDRR
ncbi:hypothetical protein BCR43DRAFT_172536 [Syncephalastrum racemosum]|uniref:Uncharacterized protein n=1 Tax=Syncephalastrum racemosum TaxID=13706 RepID=A0A1X2HPC5_SYNRA|nr:hypothetical protein BCR43DRAFT_172536 [Syncephalastrum racemosum]